MVAKAECRKYLTILWYSGSAFLALILIIQTNMGHYGNKVGEVWGWFAATIMPSVSLISGAWIQDVRINTRETGNVKGFPLFLTLMVSFLYLFASYVPIMLQGFGFIRTPPAELLNKSHLYLGPLQGIVCGYLGAFFITKPEPLIES